MARSVLHGQVLVGTGATLVVPALSRDAVTIINHDTKDVFIGGPGVTIANGALLAAGRGSAVTLPIDAALYAVVETGAATLSWIASA